MRGNEPPLVPVMSLHDLQPKTTERSLQPLSFLRRGAVVLGLTGELFAVALLVLSIVPAVLTTDPATMGIQMDTLCQCDMPVWLKVHGNRNGV